MKRWKIVREWRSVLTVWNDGGHSDVKGEREHSKQSPSLWRWVADPVHFRPASKFFSLTSIRFLLIVQWWFNFFPEKMEKFTWKCVKALFFLFKGTTLNRKITDRIRIRWKFYGSGSDQTGPDPTGSGSATLLWSMFKCKWDRLRFFPLDKCIAPFLCLANGL